MTDTAADPLRPLEPIEVMGPARSPPCPRCNFESAVLLPQPGQPNPQPERGGGFSIALICQRQGCNWRFRVSGAEYTKWRLAAAGRPAPLRDAYVIVAPSPLGPVHGPGRGWRLVRRLLGAKLS